MATDGICRYLLGVPDEEITESNRHLATWNTNKLGGRPDFMSTEAAEKYPKCKICKDELTLVVQVYAPIADLGQCGYHRTLYVFACLVCSSDTVVGSDKSECWRVFRSMQRLESIPNSTCRSTKTQHSKEPRDWLDSADDWGVMDEAVEGEPLNLNDEESSSSSPSPHQIETRRCLRLKSSLVSCELSNAEDVEDQVQVHLGTCPDILDDGQYVFMTKRRQPNRNALGGDKQFRNHANIDVDEQGNVARQSTVTTTGGICSEADVEHDEDYLSENVQSKLHVSDSMEGAVGLSDDWEAEVEPPDDVTSVVTVDTPSVPSREFIAALFGISEDTSAPPSSRLSSTMVLKSMFLAVVDEPLPAVPPPIGIRRAIVLDDHEKELLVSYQRQEGMNINELYNRSHRLESSGGELYEKYFVKHCDREFKKLRNRLRLCPQQLLRYCRDAGAAPLVISSVKGDETSEPRGKCMNCGCDTVFELQILPTAVDFIKVEGIQDYVLEFGTVVVYTCRASCWSSDAAIPFVEERVVVISDPDEVLFDALKRKPE